MMRKQVLIGLISLGISAYALASTSTVEVDNKQTAGQQDTIEAIDVFAETTWMTLKGLTRRQQAAFFSDLNALIEDEDFHVKCKSKFSERRTGSNLRTKEWQCTPNFYDSIKKDVVQKFPITTGGLTSDELIRLRSNEFNRLYKQKHEQLMVMASELLEKSPSLLKNNEAFKTANRAYKDAHIKKFGKWSKYYSEQESPQDN